ncbi:Zn(2)-C6 fungal-type domain-containing protein [Fusarium keratoplasticum]|uniref:Zn(2)-C6 fungal-type domain-containing protein n=1 Tax=Fusarium keratoplasticum TaxID=1328300 RepID=A0ACC0QL57_9HYPO|nr:Zn(2)-C6 fungal-type domain-containing protein [Fusarium keratoplasticum]KAI8658042.1 Zn(2)-C6 fungal-type domain-containing protein [Fusarium keratoplasticum]KAI8659008.1 Zn(2)-C6 fungal-type domain-containing protein [Fusarium keratoplasticum]
MPSPDCRTCRLRRIRCDRTEPHCKKCQKKGHSCPGYGIQFRFAKGIASRGRFKGAASPSETKSQASQSSPKSEPESEASHAPHFDDIPESTLNHLINYYSTNLAPINVWVNTVQNEYTRLVIPLAKTQPSLRFAILGIAAAHQAGASPEFSQSACRTAMELITERVRRLAAMDLQETRSYIENDDGSHEAILAATLILSNHSLLGSDLPLALFHIEAARVLIKTLTSEAMSKRAVFMFLTNQVAALDVLACATLFNPTHIKDPVLPELGRGPVIFGHYLHIIHSITMSSMQLEDDPPSIASLEERFELARGSTLMAIGRLEALPDGPHRHDAIRLVQAFHHAGLLYACKRLNIHEDENYHSTKLFRVFEQFEDINLSLANLSWPVFMAGICSCGNPERIRIINGLCKTLVDSSPFQYYANIPTFLEELWARDDGDWTALAKEWENQGMPVLAV